MQTYLLPTVMKSIIILKLKQLCYLETSLVIGRNIQSSLTINNAYISRWLLLIYAYFVKDKSIYQYYNIIYFFIVGLAFFERIS